MSFEVDRRLRRRLPIRWRLAGGSALLTFLILAAFGVAIGSVLTDRLRSDFNEETADAARTLAASLDVAARPGGYTMTGVSVNDYAASQHARIRILDLSGNVLGGTIAAPDFGITLPGRSVRDDFLIYTRAVPVQPTGTVLVQYARPTADLGRGIHRIWLLLIIGVAAGALLALLAGLAVARRTLRPLADLTNAAREVARTGSPDVVVPMPPANDEVRDLAETLASSFSELDSARARTEASLVRQREFVADASHELRTPLTALIANLEMLAADVDGEALEDAEAALRSGRRMRDLVGDLLLLARVDAERLTPEDVSVMKLIDSVREELGPLLGARTMEVDGVDATIEADRASLLRAVRNLMANAVVHTADSSEIRIRVVTTDSEAVIAVDDSGQGVPVEERERIFERFISGSRDHGPGTGLGLAIVKAVAESHGGTVGVSRSDLGGASFELRLPLAQASTTTGTTIGRRRSSE